MSALEPAYLLHTKPYRETSVLADFLTLHHGKIRGVLRGVRSAKRQQQGDLTLFSPKWIVWKGDGELVSISHVESHYSNLRLENQALLCGFYLNELLVRLLPLWEAYPALYAAYERVLEQLSHSINLEPPLRCFEKRLLESLGYGLPLHAVGHQADPLSSEAWYLFYPDKGAERVGSGDDSLAGSYPGSHLIALREENWSTSESLVDAKKIMRQAIDRLLGGKPLKSRELFVSI